jgi:hypothetical protein
MRIFRAVSGAVLPAVFLAIAAGGAAGCAPPPPPVLAHAETTAGLRIRITDQLDFLGNGEDEEKDEEVRKAMAGAQRALVARLTEAGYVVVDKGPFDVSASTWFTVKRPRHEDLLFARARVRLKDRKGDTVDEITLEYRNNAAPATEPDRVAVSLINEMNKSPKLLTLAQRRAKSPATPATAPGSAAPATPPTTTNL